MNLTFNQAYNYYESYYKMTFKTRSIDAAKSIFNLYILPFFDNMKMCDISKNDILKFEQKIDSLNCSYKYKKDIYVFLAMFFHYCRKYLDLEKNVVEEVGFVLKNKDENKEVADIWTYREYKKFIKKVDNVVYKRLFEFLMFTGCRVGEAQALTFKDINKNMVSINRTLIKGSRGFNSPKTKESIRKFKIDIKLRIEIYFLKRFYKKKYGFFYNNFYVFGGKKYLSHTSITRHKNNACKKANVKQIRIHDFRHTHITILLSKGVPVKAVCKRVGHKEVDTTLNIYSHVLEKDNKRIIKSLNLLRMSIF